MNKYKYLLFDADNTLFDFNRCERSAFRLALEGSALAYSDEVYSLYHKINDDLWKVLEKGGIDRKALKTERYRRLFERCGAVGDGYVEVAKRYEKYLGEQTFEIDGVYEMLSDVRCDHKIFVITNGITSVQENRFSKSRLTSLIDGLFISEMIGFSKPDPKFFDEVVSKIGDEDKSSYLVIGDSLTSDIDGALRYGFDCCWYNREGSDAMGREPTYIIDDITDIRTVL